MISDCYSGMFLNCSSLSLNPCFNGIWYLTQGKKDKKQGNKRVLILVLMEYDIWLNNKQVKAVKEL